MLWSVAEVPFSEECRFVAAGLQRLGERGFLEWQEGLDFQAPEPLFRLVLAAGQPIRDAQAGWRFASQDAGAAGGADRCSGVGIGEAHAFLRQSVEVRRLVKGAPVAAEVRPAEVVGDDENDVWHFLGGSCVESGGWHEQTRGQKKAAIQKWEMGRLHRRGRSVRLLRSMSSLPVISSAWILISRFPGARLIWPSSRATSMPCWRTLPLSV